MRLYTCSQYRQDSLREDFFEPCFYRPAICSNRTLGLQTAGTARRHVEPKVFPDARRS